MALRVGARGRLAEVRVWRRRREDGPVQRVYTLAFLCCKVHRPEGGLSSRWVQTPFETFAHCWLPMGTRLHRRTCVTPVGDAHRDALLDAKAQPRHNRRGRRRGCVPRQQQRRRASKAGGLAAAAASAVGGRWWRSGTLGQGVEAPLAQSRYVCAPDGGRGAYRVGCCAITDALHSWWMPLRSIPSWGALPASSTRLVHARSGGYRRNSPFYAIQTSLHVPRLHAGRWLSLPLHLASPPPLPAPAVSACPPPSRLRGGRLAG